MINTRTGDTLTVTSQGQSTIVVLTDDTVTRDRRGLFGLEKTQLSNVVLIPGLKVNVNGTSDAEGRIVAKTITVDGDDLESAEMIQAGLHPTAQQVAANEQLLAVHGQGIAANQQSIAAHQASIEQSMKDIDAHTERFNALADYDTKGEATVKFKSGSSRISAADMEQLKQLAQTAQGLTGYMIEVTG